MTEIAGLMPVDGKLIHALLDSAAEEYPGNDALSDDRITLTYSELADRSRRIAGWLAERGIGHGDRVLVSAASRVETIALLYAVVRLGAVFVPINPGMKPYHLNLVVEDAEPRLAITEDADKIDGLPVHRFSDVWSAASVAEHAENAVVAPDDLAVLIYTSGSTAEPKAVMCPHGPIVFAVRAIQDELGYRSTDTVFCRLPLSFDYGLFQAFLAALGGARLHVTPDRPGLSLMSELRDSGATIVPVVPSLGGMLVSLSRGKPVPGPVRMFTNTGAALPQSTIDSLRQSFPDAQVVRMFGTTECKRTTVMPPGQEFERPGSCGKALAGTTVLILDEDGTTLPAGAVGEIVVRGPNVMAGYWRRTELTERTFRSTSDGRQLHTGDYGYLDDDGFLYFEGRRDDMFKRRGIRMTVTEIEAAALDIPGVRSAAVLPPGDDHDLVIWVAGDVKSAQVLRGLSERLEPQKVPAKCTVLEELPLTVNGKNAKKVLAEMLAGGES